VPTGQGWHVNVALAHVAMTSAAYSDRGSAWSAPSCKKEKDFQTLSIEL
jgi:hypothetical protein